jgi:hypothetical protein
LTAVEPDGRVRWQAPAGESRGQHRVAADGGIWLCGNHTTRTAPSPEAGAAWLHEILPDGSSGRRIALSAGAGESLFDFLILTDGFVLAWSTVPDYDYQGARVERVDIQGARIWSTPLPFTELSHPGLIQMEAATDWRATPIKPSTPRYFRPNGREGLLVAGDRLLATYREYWPTGLGVSYCFDLDSGRVAWTTPSGPIADRAITGAGTFLLGEAGYGAFASRLYDRDGSVLDEWPSAGRALVSHRGRIRIVESYNGTSLHASARLRRLHRNGTVTDGPVLPNEDGKGPALSRDGTAVFWRADALHVAGPDLALRTLYRERGWTGRDRILLLDGGVLAFVLGRDHPGDERRLVLVPTNLGPLDDGPLALR